jgi:glycerophosphoryl diester phosphodiesterase
MTTKIIINCLALFLLISCKKEEFTVTNLNGNRIECLGHGGMGIKSTYPMDSYESIQRCLNLGADGTDIDVQMTDDSVLILFHDQYLSEMTNLTGLVNSLKWDEVSEAYYTMTPYLNYPVISVEQLFAGIYNINEYTFTFDCKLYPVTEGINYYEQYCNALIRIIDQFGLKPGKICIESQNTEFLQLLKHRRPELRLFIYPDSFEEGLEKALELDLSGITISTRNVTREQIALAHSHNLMVATWNVHSAEDNKKAIRKNPDFIQTDELKNLIRLLK